LQLGAALRDARIRSVAGGIRDELDVSAGGCWCRATCRVRANGHGQYNEGAILFINKQRRFSDININSVVLFSDIDNGGRCLDGSPAGFYIQQASTMQSTWVIYLEGGGACADKDSCTERATTSLGSSTHWPDGKWPKAFSLADDPDFAAANHVFVPYCSGDEHSGTNLNTTAESFGLYFQGHLNLARMLERLHSHHGLGDGARMLLTGQSAGGIGAFKNADFVSDKLERLGLSNTTLKAAPNAGWFWPGDPRALPAGVGMPIVFENWTATPLSPTNWSAPTALMVKLWGAFLPPACTSAMASKGLDPTFCNSVHNVYTHTKVPVLTIENQFDSYQLSHSMGVPSDPKSAEQKAQVDAYTAYYGGLMRDSTAQVARKEGDGLFLPSCLTHVVSASATVHGYTYLQHVSDWFFGRGEIPNMLIDPCTSADGAPCGKGCKHAVEE
jgi:hypothetical protein